MADASDVKTSASEKIRGMNGLSVRLTECLLCDLVALTLTECLLCDQAALTVTYEHIPFHRTDTRRLEMNDARFPIGYRPSAGAALSAPFSSTDRTARPARAASRSSARAALRMFFSP